MLRGLERASSFEWLPKKILYYLSYVSYLRGSVGAAVIWRMETFVSTSLSVCWSVTAHLSLVWPCRVGQLTYSFFFFLGDWPVSVHTLLPVTYKWPSWISQRGRMTTDTISWSVSTKLYGRPRNRVCEPTLRDNRPTSAVSALIVFVFPVCFQVLFTSHQIRYNIVLFKYSDKLSRINSANNPTPNNPIQTEYSMVDNDRHIGRNFHHMTFLYISIFPRKQSGVSCPLSPRETVCVKYQKKCRSY